MKRAYVAVHAPAVPMVANRDKRIEPAPLNLKAGAAER